MINKRKLHTTMLVLALLLGVVTLAQSQDVPTQVRYLTNPDSIQRPYEVLLIKKDGNRAKAVNPKNGDVVCRRGGKRRYNVEVIEWALYNARVTAVVGNTVSLDRPVRIPTSYTTLIIGPNATLVGTEPGAVGRTPPTESNVLNAVIENDRRDHVRIFNFGTLDTGVEGPSGFMVRYDGRSGGKTGINGGLLFGTGETKGSNDAYFFVDSQNVHVPVVWSRKWGHGIILSEGNQDLRVGLAAGLSTGENQGQSETVDLNSYDKGTRLQHVIGTFHKGQQDEILDVNNAPNTWVGKVVGYGDVEGSPDEGVTRRGKNVDLVDRNHYNIGQRRQTQMPHFGKNSPGLVVEDAHIVEKDVKEWKTSVKLPGFPDKLPTLNIKVRLKAVYEDGSSEMVFAKNYRYEQ